MSVISPKATEYPESDGLPMGETDIHLDWMIRQDRRTGKELLTEAKTERAKRKAAEQRAKDAEDEVRRLRELLKRQTPDE